MPNSGLPMLLLDDTVNEDDEQLQQELNDNAYAEILAAILASSRRAAEVNRCNQLNTINTNKTLDCKFDRLISEVGDLRCAIEEKIDSINRKIKQTNRLFQASQDYEKRSGKICELVLMGIPYRQGENLREYFVKICKVLKFSDQEIPLVYITRLLNGAAGSSGSEAKLKIPRYSQAILDNLKIRSSSKSGSSQKTPNESIIVVQFVFRNARHEFYRRYLDHKALSLRDIGLDSGSRIFVNENLTRTNLGLKAEAMKMKREGKLKNVFTVNGQIYVRRSNEHRSELVTSTVDLLLMDENKMKSNKENYPRVLEHIIHTQPYVLSRDYKEILNTLDIVSSDSEISVRSSLSSWLQRLCVSCLDREQSVNSEFGRCVLEKVLNITIRYLTDEPGVRCGAFETLSYLIEKGFLDKATTEETVCPVVEKLSRKPLDTFDEELYAIFIHLMVKIVPIVGYAKTYELVYERFLELCRCKEHFVRRECATAFPVMCEVLGDELFEKSMLPIFMKLCDDEIWTVRKACAEVLPIVALLCTLDKRRKVLVPAMKKFMFDPSQWVIVAALKNLGQFLTTFTQLRVLGLAYNSNLELMVTNAADHQSFQQLDMRRVTYGNQPSADVLLKNFECYEKRFRDSIQRYALLSLVKSNEEPWKARGDEMINVEVYLYSIVYAVRSSDMLSTGSNSDDGGISKISDFSYKYYVRKSLSSSSLCGPPPVQLHRGGRNYDEKNPLNRFLRYCWPLKNNFSDAFAKQGSTGNGRDSESDDYLGGWAPDEDSYSMLAMQIKINLGGSDDGDGGGTARFDEPNSTINSNANNNQRVPETEEKKPEKRASEQNLHFGEHPSEDESVDQSFNSHQFWYISPELPLDLDFIDADTLGKDGDSNKNSDISNNNAISASMPIASSTFVAPIAKTELECQEDNKNNNSKVASEAQETSTMSTTDEVTPENDPANDSDSSYGSINNSESEKPDTDVERYCSDLKQQQQQQHQHQKFSAGSVGSFHQHLDAVSVGIGALAIGKESDRLKDLIKWQNEEVEWNLLEDFVHMKNINKELCYDCAFNFPAIVLTFGEKFWPILSSHFFALCNDIQNTVRRTMAASISKVALIIGREHATRDLVAPYTEFLMDSDEIKIEVVNTLAEFLKVIDGSEHETLMDQLSLCLKPPLNMMNWRFREAIARQLIELVKIHTKIRKENCLLYLTGLAMRLMMDKYDFVRKAGVDAFVECTTEFQKNGAVFKFFTEHFANNVFWRRRQTYIITAGKMLETGNIEVETFRKYVLNNVLALVNDAVPNVRIQLGKCLKDIILPHASFSPTCPDADAIEQVLAKLRSDPDRDVRGHIDGYQNTEEDDCVAVGAPEMIAITDSNSSSSTSSTSSLSSPPPPPHAVDLSAAAAAAATASPEERQHQHHQQLQPQQLEFPVLSNDTWYFDINQQQEYEF